MHIKHHGAVNGVTGSCHQLILNEQSSLLIDCGIFQGEDSNHSPHINFDISTVKALIVTHCHIDHVGRIPYLLAAGFKGPIYTSPASAKLLPLVIEDALKVGVTRNESMIRTCLKLLKQQIVVVPFNTWLKLTPLINDVSIKFKRAGHILGSAYIEVDIGRTPNKHRVVFSGDLGAPYTPLLPTPKPPYKADTLVIESTYGDKNHQGRKERVNVLKNIIERAVSDNGVVLIPAFSIGRTQELLYELEQIISATSKHSLWRKLQVIVDSPMAANFTNEYIHFKDLWDNEAKNRVSKGRHPLDFSQLHTIDTHQEHQALINFLASKRQPAIIIAASGMCSGGRIVNYLKRFLEDTTTDVIFVGYQGRGTLGRDIQTYGPRGGYVFINNKKVTINAKIHTISGYSAHADQKGLLRFVTGMKKKPSLIRIVHGDDEAKETLANKYRELLGDKVKIEIGTE
ncbi:metallo-beta-lactamase [Pseudoalteromonas lipolytica SCSIO 04301]|uniref:MBL fold metallo-hydrolase RNA specificity domain-containing protein n=1 Tax=Pseudoalteromonas lipolytica TaxID=570156 RepID=UPI00044A3DE9|nr:MBL fold metallo-hydrolase [Pseudoalteromonas lipolytica]EWH04586.1 metallo-beta-lactamase [Pseudoalteromonas lipolytica SCSIO 04301]